MRLGICSPMRRGDARRRGSIAEHSRRNDYADAVGKADVCAPV